MLEGLQGLVEGSESSTNNGVFFGVGGITQRCLHTVNEIRTGLGVSGLEALDPNSITCTTLKGSPQAEQQLS